VRTLSSLACFVAISCISTGAYGQLTEQLTGSAGVYIPVAGTMFTFQPPATTANTFYRGIHTFGIAFGPAGGGRYIEVDCQMVLTDATVYDFYDAYTITLDDNGSWRSTHSHDRLGDNPLRLPAGDYQCRALTTVMESALTDPLYRASDWVPFSVRQQP